MNVGADPGSQPKRLRVKVRVSGSDPRVPTVMNLWAAANWAERELYDFFGIVVGGHPDLRRILMPEDWDGHPMRRDYPVQIKMPVCRPFGPAERTGGSSRMTGRTSAAPSGTGRSFRVVNSNDASSLSGRSILFIQTGKKGEIPCGTTT